MRLRSVVTGAIPPRRYELVDFGPVLGKAQPIQELLKLALFFFEVAQCIGAILVESAISARGARSSSPPAPAHAVVVTIQAGLPSSSSFPGNSSSFAAIGMRRPRCEC
jgi:hypothetical protein